MSAPEIFDWPSVLVPVNPLIMAPSKTIGGTTSETGFTQVQPFIRPPFRLTLRFGALHGAEVLAWRALIGSLEGRANVVRIPLFDVWFRASDAAIGAGAVAHSDGTAFSDGALYLTDDLVGVGVTGVQGQRWIEVDFGAYGPQLQAGLYFGIGEHPYLATAVHWTGSVARIRCSPTLRLDYAAAPLKLKPTMIGRQTSDDGGALELERARYATGPVLELEEALDVLLS